MQNTNASHRPKALPQIVARAILGDLAAGRLHAGDRLGEESYSARCEVSRTPVRKALDMLCDADLAERRGRQGCYALATKTRARQALASPTFKAATPQAMDSNNPEPSFVETARRIRALLVDPSVFPQDVLRDTAVARTLGVSRTTASRALGLLARENLVQPVPRRGWKRTALGPESFLHWYEFRLAVEPAALESGWSHLDPEAIEHLYDRTREVLKQLNRTGRQALADLDAELHQMILHACRNTFLKGAMEQQEALRYIAGAPTWNLSDRVRQTFDEHLEVLEAMRTGQKANSMNLLRKHLRNARDHMAYLYRTHAKKGACRWLPPCASPSWAARCTTDFMIASRCSRRNRAARSK